MKKSRPAEVSGGRVGVRRVLDKYAVISLAEQQLCLELFQAFCILLTA